MPFFAPIKSSPTLAASFAHSNKSPFNRMAYASSAAVVFADTTARDSRYTTEHFLNALKYGRDVARANQYISKNYVDKLDLSLIPLPEGVTTPVLVKGHYDKLPRGCDCHTVLMFSQGGVCFMHIYTYGERDSISNDKIYDIELEYL